MSDEALPYLRQTELVEALNRVVNRVVKERPPDPVARASELLAAAASPGADSSSAKVAELKAELAASETRAAKVAALEADLAASTRRVAALELERGERAMQLSDADREVPLLRFPTTSDCLAMNSEEATTKYRNLSLRNVLGGISGIWPRTTRGGTQRLARARAAPGAKSESCV